MSNRLSIRRLNATYLVPRDLEAPEAARRRLDEVVTRRLADDCARLLSRALDPHDDSVWLIRRLDIELALDLGAADDDLIARAWAQRTAVSLARALAAGPDGTNVIRFPDAASHLAQFVLDLAEGRAWGKWYYDSFDSLRSLPAGAAVCEALVRTPGTASEVLSRLDARGAASLVIGSLDTRGARRVYAACGEGTTPPSPGTNARLVVELLAALWHGAGLRAPEDEKALWHEALRLHLALRRAAPAAADSLAHEAVPLLLTFASLVGGAKSRDEFIDSVARGLGQSVEGLKAAGPAAASLAFMAEAANGDAGWLGRVAQVVSPASKTSGPDAPAPSVRAFGSVCGGLFLLLPALLDLKVDELFEAAPLDLPEAGAEPALYRYLWALKSLGRLNEMTAASDPAPAFVAGLDTAPAFEDLRALARATTAESSRACLRRLLALLAARGRIEGHTLAAQLVVGGDEETLLLRDTAHDFWVYAASLGDDALEEELARGLALVSEATGAKVETLLLAGGIERKLDLGALTRTGARLVREGEDEPSALPEVSRHALANYISNARPAAPDLEYFSLPGLAPRAGATLDLTWSLVARAVSREFALRLVGFAWSSAGHLSQNFLGGSAGVRIGREDVDVQLSGVPLALVLRMAGINGLRFNVPWLNDRQISLSLTAD